MARQSKGKARSDDRDQIPVRQPAWREATPRPRKRAKRNTLTIHRTRNQKERRDEKAAIAIRVPSREVLLGWGRIVLLFVAAAAVAVGLIYLLRWPLLFVSPATTLISGAQRITPTEIYTQSKVGDRNILLIRATEVVSQVESLPGIASARVHMRLPNQVIIDVVEHTPLVAWETVTTTVWLADDGSEVPQAGGLPPLRLTDQTEGRLSRDASLRAMVLEDLKNLHTVRPELTEFQYGSSQGLYYRAEEGWDVWLGESGQVADKLALVDAAGQDIVEQGAQPKVIDVRQSALKALWW